MISLYFQESLENVNIDVYFFVVQTPSVAMFYILTPFLKIYFFQSHLIFNIILPSGVSIGFDIYLTYKVITWISLVPSWHHTWLLQCYLLTG